MGKSSFDIKKFAEDVSNYCDKAQVKEFEKNEIITTYIVNRSMIFIVLEGSADLLRYDFNGNQTIVEKFNKYDVFGEIFYRININNELFVKAREKSKILMFNYDIFEKKCKKNCKFHEELLIGLPNLVLTKVSDLNLRIELLSQKTIRDKILSYFRILSENNFSKTFTLPFSLSDLADYLSVDRSAMMRELKTLIDEGFISKSRNKIKLLY
jgi:CRP-like cAMP-binding protein